jgi:glycosyltransferase involved in cell wall biosynthesis
MTLQDPGGVRIVIAAPYPEGAVLAIARSASRRRELDRFFTTLYWGSDAQSTLAPRSRRRLVGVPHALVSQCARPTEVARTCAHLAQARTLSARLMYANKERFDSAVAGEIDSARADVVVGLYAATTEIFRRARIRGMTTILHFVNSHPRTHNNLLAEAGAPLGSSEYIPQRVVDRVEKEIEAADLVLVPSRFVAHQLLELGTPAERVAEVPYGVDPIAFSPSPARTRTAGGPLHCLYVGQISWRKGVRVLVEAARELMGTATFELVGPMVSPDVVRDAPPNVNVKTSVTHADLHDTYARADVFILPSIEDAYGLVALEALAMGLPLVISDGAGASEAVTHGLNGLVIARGSAPSIVDAISELTSQERRAALGDAGRRLVTDAYGWESYASRVLELARCQRTAGGVEAVA